MSASANDMIGTSDDSIVDSSRLNALGLEDIGFGTPPDRSPLMNSSLIKLEAEVCQRQIGGLGCDLNGRNKTERKFPSTSNHLPTQICLDHTTSAYIPPCAKLLMWK